MSRNRCSICGGDAVTVTEPREIHVGRRTATVDVDFFRCNDCEESFFRPGQLDAAQEAASQKIRDELGLLQPEEIKSIREKYGLSQADFERLLGVGAKTVVRWEKGTVFQNSATDSLLRLIRADPLNAVRLAHHYGVQLPALPRASDTISAAGASLGAIYASLKVIRPIHSHLESPGDLESWDKLARRLSRGVASEMGGPSPSRKTKAVRFDQPRTWGADEEEDQTERAKAYG